MVDEMRYMYLFSRWKYHSKCITIRTNSYSFLRVFTPCNINNIRHIIFCNKRY